MALINKTIRNIYISFIRSWYYFQNILNVPLLIGKTVVHRHIDGESGWGRQNNAFRVFFCLWKVQYHNRNIVYGNTTIMWLYIEWGWHKNKACLAGISNNAYTKAWIHTYLLFRVNIIYLRWIFIMINITMQHKFV